ncbi:MAG: hypothetical protein WBE76_20130 [Terracidiphilus sp.]
MTSAIPWITAQEIADCLLAIVAFVPATVCIGYLAAWFTNLHDFRRRTFVERLFWSVPLSLAISTIASVLIGRFLSLAAVSWFFAACAVVWLVTFSRELLQHRRSGGILPVGWRPLGGWALAWAIAWVAVAILSLVDFQSGHRLFMSVTIIDHSYRVNWIDSVLRTGVPPANSLYWYKHATGMRTYYFWYVLCAAIARMTNLPARAVLDASCVWAGFALAAVIGLYLKHFLRVGSRLRRQFLLCVSLLLVTGLDIIVILWETFVLHQPPPGDLEWWSKGEVTSWLDSLLWVPHHVAGMFCCMMAFLLAWITGEAAGKQSGRGQIVSVILISCALASAFGLSIYVAFGFFLVMLTWGVWQLTFERAPRPVLLLAAGGAGAALLLIPYLWELTHTASGMMRRSVFEFDVRQMFPPDVLLATAYFQRLAAGHPSRALNLANLVLLIPGYVIELGFCLLVLLIYLVPAWRGRKPLDAPRRALVFIAAATLPFITFIRSWVVETNDFGWRVALFVQFSLLLLASELLAGWVCARREREIPANCADLPQIKSKLLRSLAYATLAIGLVTTASQAFVLRFLFPLAEAHPEIAPDMDAARLSHTTYISFLGYAQLDASIPRDAIVQYDPAESWPYGVAANMREIGRQTAIFSDFQDCGSLWGGDPTGCRPMRRDIDPLFQGATAQQARAMCARYGIGYLVARVYDPAWNDSNGWVWTLRPIVSDQDFRALDCRAENTPGR